MNFPMYMAQWFLHLASIFLSPHFSADRIILLSELQFFATVFSVCAFIGFAVFNSTCCQLFVFAASVK